MSEKNINYKKIEGILFSYNRTKCEIANLKIDIEELKDDISLGGKSDNPIPGRVSARTNTSKVEIEAEKREKKIAAMEREIRSKERFLRKIDNALEILNKNDKEFVKLRYLDNISMVNLSDSYGVEPITLYKRKDVIIQSLISVL